jgi:hypothetical protein
MQELLNEIKPPTPSTNPSPFPFSPPKPVVKSPVRVKPFSEVIKQKEEESGVVVKPSSAAPDTLPKPIRPNIYFPRS